MLNSITKGDAADVMGGVDSGSVHLVVTSPSYPMIEKWDELYTEVDFESQHSLLDIVWGQCYRALVDGGLMCINIGDATRSIDGQFQCYPNYARVVMECVRLGFVPLIPILWKKISNRPNAFLGSGFSPPNAYVAQDHEYIAILRKGRLRKFRPKDPDRAASRYTRAERDLWFQQVWDIRGLKGAKTTSAFPYEVPYRLISMFSVIGDVVLDPFCGTGTTGKAAGALGRDHIGITL